MARYCSLSLPDKAYHHFLEHHILGENDVSSNHGVTTIGFSCDEGAKARSHIYIQSDIGNIIDYLMDDCHVPFDFKAEPAEAGYEEDHGYYEFYRPNAPEEMQHASFLEDEPSIPIARIQELMADYPKAEDFQQQLSDMVAWSTPITSIQKASQDYNMGICNHKEEKHLKKLLQKQSKHRGGGR